MNEREAERPAQHENLLRLGVVRPVGSAPVDCGAVLDHGAERGGWRLPEGGSWQAYRPLTDDTPDDTPAG
ncbi:hypothetical protein [Actinokineospora iranica]|uniref:hypothetical protein n=1 Tax=Actinokineospora iranica TaxID=1271860 RepID=UPI001113978B|nr:hypothetical protein [Actinokineospora iranica]